MTSAIALVTGFVVGLVYSKGKLNPVQCAMDDARRAGRWVCRQARQGWGRVRDIQAGGKEG